MLRRVCSCTTYYLYISHFSPLVLRTSGLIGKSVLHVPFSLCAVRTSFFRSYTTCTVVRRHILFTEPLRERKPIQTSLCWMARPHKGSGATGLGYSKSHLQSGASTSWLQLLPISILLLSTLLGSLVGDGPKIDAGGQRLKPVTAAPSLTAQGTTAKILTHTVRYHQYSLYEVKGWSCLGQVLCSCRSMSASH